jgi:ABC-type cobalamin/Fe3+-siderophores transport system ATPase subunit
MRLTHLTVTNFKSVEDSGEFSVGDVTCLVGKNEAGKTALLHALHRLNPDNGEALFDTESSYPRRFLSEYKERHPNEDARVLNTVWQLSDKEVAGLKGIIGPKALTGTTITIYKRYNEKTSTWTVGGNETAAAEYVLSKSGLHAEEQAALAHLKTIDALKKQLGTLGAAANERHTAFSQHLEKYFKRGSANTAIIDFLDIPKFFYFASYDRMSGQVALEQMMANKANNKLDRSDQVFIAFLGLVGTTLEEMATLNRFEPMIAKLESVSNRISREIFTYWTQNRNLKVQFRLDAGRTGDPAPYNSGNILRTRVENTIHEASVSFDDRSTGFVWFFSFLVLFSQFKKTHGDNVILLLDEPGTSLHAKAQEDLLRYFKEKLIPHHQVIYTTHSPFMVPADNLMAARTVEDVVIRDKQGNVQEVLGTKVSDNVLSVDRETLFPLQGALGYEITQTLFIGKNSLLVEGPSDLLYLKAYSAELKQQGRTGLSQAWTITPVGGVDKVSAFMSLLYGNKLNVAVLTDFAKGQKKKIDDLKKLKLLSEAQILTANTYTGTGEADIEDLISRDGYIALVKQAYNLPVLKVASPGTERVVKDVEDAFRLLPPSTPEFDHFFPSSFLIEKPAVLKSLPSYKEALDRFERLFKDLNTLLP